MRVDLLQEARPQKPHRHGQKHARAPRPASRPASHPRRRQPPGRCRSGCVWRKRRRRQRWRWRRQGIEDLAQFEARPKQGEGPPERHARLAPKLEREIAREVHRPFLSPPAGAVASAFWGGVGIDPAAGYRVDRGDRLGIRAG